MIPCILESPFAAPKALRDTLEAERAKALVGETSGSFRAALTAVERAEAKHRRYLKALARYAFEQGFAPFASHALYTQWLDDNDPAERKLGIEAGFAMAELLERGGRVQEGCIYATEPLVILVGMDLGVSTGMELGIKLHHKHGRDVREVRLGSDWGRKPRVCLKEFGRERREAGAL